MDLEWESRRNWMSKDNDRECLNGEKRFLLEDWEGQSNGAW